MYVRNAKLALAAVVVCAISLIAGSVATAGISPPTTRPCTYGDALQTFESAFTGNLLNSECQYRLYETRRTFCEGDYILGGIVSFIPYQDLGIPREEAVAYMELYEDRVWIDGVEMPLMYTDFKNGVRPTTGEMMVYQHAAFISQLPVGRHTSLWESFHPEEGRFRNRTQLVVLPATDPACT